MKKPEFTHFNDSFINQSPAAIERAKREGRVHHAEQYQRSLDRAIEEREAAMPKSKVIEFPKKQEGLF